MNEKDNIIEIPIKNIIEQSMLINRAQYEEYEIVLLRKCFIAVLNLGYFEIKQLKKAVDKLTYNIKT